MSRRECQVLVHHLDAEVGLSRGDSRPAALEVDLAASGRVARQRLDERGLACTVVADQCRRPPRDYVEVCAVQRADIAGCARQHAPPAVRSCCASPCVRWRAAVARWSPGRQTVDRTSPSTCQLPQAAGTTRCLRWLTSTGSLFVAGAHLRPTAPPRRRSRRARQRRVEAGPCGRTAPPLRAAPASGLRRGGVPRQLRRRRSSAVVSTADSATSGQAEKDFVFGRVVLTAPAGSTDRSAPALPRGARPARSRAECHPVRARRRPGARHSVISVSIASASCASTRAESRSGSTASRQPDPHRSVVVGLEDVPRFGLSVGTPEMPGSVMPGWGARAREAVARRPAISPAHRCRRARRRHGRASRADQPGPHLAAACRRRVARDRGSVRRNARRWHRSTPRVSAHRPAAGRATRPMPAHRRTNAAPHSEAGVVVARSPVRRLPVLLAASRGDWPVRDSTPHSRLCHRCQKIWPIRSDIGDILAADRPGKDARWRPCATLPTVRG